MKVSVSLPEEDVEFLDAYAVTAGIESRSAVLHKAVRLLRAVELGEDYAAAWHDWEAAEDSALWQATMSDGVTG
ncbi:MAG: ribbon-helix-helix domain-containing protein [Actinomycetota bacterium]|nr:ribbon-helix-helix domain-containing protein [Actinomycetota bacterium]